MLHDVINRLKKEKNLTNVQLASLSGITLSTIDKITAGINTNPKLDTLQAICRVLGCTLDDLDDTITKNAPLLSSSEQELIQKYRRLDAHGKEIVDIILEKEYIRLTQQVQVEKADDKILTTADFDDNVLRTAAFGGGVEDNDGTLYHT